MTGGGLTDWLSVLGVIVALIANLRGLRILEEKEGKRRITV